MSIDNKIAYQAICPLGFCVRYCKLMEQWITLVEAVKLSGYNSVHLRRLLRAGDVAGKKVSIVWLVDRQDLLRYMAWIAERGSKGRPKTGD